MDVVAGVEALRPEHGPIFAVIGVFDGLHRGHTYLLDHLVHEARTRDARPTVITFDHHPDEVLTGKAPPLLLHPDERLDRLGDAGVEVAVVQHFDDTVRRTTYDAFIDTIRRGTTLAGLLMTPDAAFGFERRGTADAVTELGRARGFDVVVVPQYTIDGAPVSSSAIRDAIQRGDLEEAQRLLGRPVGLRGTVDDGRMTFDLPMATPPDGVYPCQIDGRSGTLTVHDGTIRVEAGPVDGPVRVELTT
jgi:riboflavin kinase / FMN adenylyltransferase